MVADIDGRGVSQGLLMFVECDRSYEWPYAKILAEAKMGLEADLGQDKDVVVSPIGSQRVLDKPFSDLRRTHPRHVKRTVLDQEVGRGLGNPCPVELKVPVTLYVSGREMPSGLEIRIAQERAVVCILGYHTVETIPDQNMAVR